MKYLARRTKRFMLTLNLGFYHHFIADGHVENITIMLGRGFPVNDGHPLHEAVNHSQFEVLRLLVSYGADLEKRNYYGKTALHMAVLYKASIGIPMMKELLRLGANLEACVVQRSGFKNDQNETSLRLIMNNYYRNFNMVKLLVARGADMVECGAIHVAAARAKLRVLYMMLKAGADPDAPYAGNSELTTMPLPGQKARELFTEHYNNWKGRNYQIVIIGIRKHVFKDMTFQDSEDVDPEWAKYDDLPLFVRARTCWLILSCLHMARRDKRRPSASYIELLV